MPLNKAQFKQLSRHNIIGKLGTGSGASVTNTTNVINNDITLTAGEDLTLGMLIGIGSDGLAYHFTNLSTDDLEAVGIALANSLTSNTISVRVQGIATSGLTGMTINNIIYARNGVINLSQTALSDKTIDEDLHLCVGIATDTDKIFVNICEKYRFL